jgi:hypothetical protein
MEYLNTEPFLYISVIIYIQGGSNITGTDLCVNKPHCAAAVRPWESGATTSTLPERWKKCVDFGGEYVEDWHVQVCVWQLWFKKLAPVIFEPPCNNVDEQVSNFD